jgi:hypothetical protein
VPVLAGQRRRHRHRDERDDGERTAAGEPPGRATRQLPLGQHAPGQRGRRHDRHQGQQGGNAVGQTHVLPGGAGHAEGPGDDPGGHYGGVDQHRQAEPDPLGPDAERQPGRERQLQPAGS